MTFSRTGIDRNHRQAIVAFAACVSAAAPGFAHAQSTLAESQVDALEGLFGKQQGFRRTQAKGLCASGYFVGKWMAGCPEDGTPWWRIVNAKGELPIAKRDPRMAIDQRTRLEQEGVPFDGDLINREAFWDPLSLF